MNGASAPGARRNVRVLTFTTLYPNRAQPNHGVFVENRLLHTLAVGGLEATVMAPVPFFPCGHAVFGRFGTYARVPREELRNGLRVIHPRFLAIPKLGAGYAPRLLYQSAKQALAALKRGGADFDVIDAHYFYPDGVAACLLGRDFGLPVALTGRGTDLTLIPSFSWARPQIEWAAQQASALITVCEALKTRLVEMGVPGERVEVLRNGVDLKAFRPGDRAAARAELGLTGLTLLSVGGLIARKGHELVLRALTMLPDCSLLVVGDGPLKHHLATLIQRLGLSARAKLVGEVPHRELVKLYNAADVLVLASEREGLANVLLESMACGTPVVATDVDGSSEVISPLVGRLVVERTPRAIADAVRALRAAQIDRAAVRSHAEQFDWHTTAKKNVELLTSLAYPKRNQ